MPWVLHMRAGLHPEWPASTRRLGSYTVLGFVLGWRTLPVDCSALLHLVAVMHMSLQVQGCVWD